MRFGTVRALCLIVLAGCGAGMTAPTQPVTAFGVLLTVTVPGRCLATCDPISPTVSRVGLVRVLNAGPQTVYFPNCGAPAGITEQELVNGMWVTVGPVIGYACTTNGPTTLAAGDSIQLNWIFAPGRRRLVTTVASSASLTDPAPDASASFDVR
jgi:hypothetical protein